MVSGTIEALIVGIDGQELVLNRMEQDDIVGEVAALDGGERTAGVRAVQDSVLLRYGRDRLMSILEEQPPLMSRLMLELCRRIRNTTNLAKGVIVRRPGPRLAALLLQIADKDDFARATHEDLAKRLGLTRETVSREISAWRSHGYVGNCGRGCIRIIDRDALVDEAQM